MCIRDRPLSPFQEYIVTLLGGKASEENENVTAEELLWFIVTELLLYGDVVC